MDACHQLTLISAFLGWKTRWALARGLSFEWVVDEAAVRVKQLLVTVTQHKLLLSALFLFTSLEACTSWSCRSLFALCPYTLNRRLITCSFQVKSESCDGSAGREWLTCLFGDVAPVGIWCEWHSCGEESVSNCSRQTFFKVSLKETTLKRGRELVGKWEWCLKLPLQCSSLGLGFSLLGLVFFYCCMLTLQCISTTLPSLFSSCYCIHFKLEKHYCQQRTLYELEYLVQILAVGLKWTYTVIWTVWVSSKGLLQDSLTSL